MLTLGTGGCGSTWSSGYPALRPELVRGDYRSALARLEPRPGSAYGAKDELLYLMDRGMLLHLAGDWTASNAVLAQAQQTAEALWTESIGEHAAALLTTDNALSYPGEDFELAFLHVLAALNYLGLQQHDEAQVETRALSVRLQQLSDRYQQAPNRYRDDAFMRWLGGRLHEEAHRRQADAQALGDAWVDYRHALE
ncbi:MAG: hypothetical protein EOO40_12650, partial [Deltaproteobacteria bacterium]